jgi:hypothetical protein
VNGSFALVIAASIMVVAALVAVPLVIIRAYRLDERQRLARQQAVATLCAQHGLGPGAVPGDFAILDAFPRSWLSNAFSSPDHGVAAADFIRPTTRQSDSLLALTVVGLDAPHLAVTRRNLGVVGALVPGGPPPFQLESTEFDRQFRVKAEDSRNAVKLLDPGMRQLLLDCEEVSFVMVGAQVLAFVNRIAAPAHKPNHPLEFEQLFRFWDGFVVRLPALLRSRDPGAQ